MDPAAEELKNQANEVFKNKDYERALELYSKAIEVDGTSGKGPLLSALFNIIVTVKKPF